MINILKTSNNTGKQAEKIACRFLKKQSLQLIHKNYYCRYGEIDLIMKDNDTLVFIEVRYRHSNSYGNAIDTIDARKLSKIKKTIDHYLMTNKLGYFPCRIDVIGLQGNLQSPDIQWIRNAI